MIEARGGHTATLLPDRAVLVVGGIGSDTEETGPFNTTLASAELFDPATGSWTATGTLDEGRTGHTATLLRDGTVLLTRMGREGSAELCDPAAGSFTATGNMDVVRFYHAATLLPDGKVLVAGDFSDDDQGRSAELYDAGSGRWAPTVSMDESRDGLSATLLTDGRVLVAGGSDELGRLGGPG